KLVPGTHGFDESILDQVLCFAGITGQSARDAVEGVHVGDGFGRELIDFTKVILGSLGRRHRKSRLSLQSTRVTGELFRAGPCLRDANGMPSAQGGCPEKSSRIGPSRRELSCQCDSSFAVYRQTGNA